MTKHYRRLLQVVFLAVGVFLFVSVIKKIGWADVFHSVARINYWFILVLILSTFWYWLYTKGWQQLLKPFGGALSTYELFRAKISGEAVNCLNPANFVVGDPVRIYLVRKGFRVREGAASVVVDRTIHSISILFIILLGIIVGFPVLTFLPEEIQTWIPIFVAVLTILIALVIIFQHRGLFVLPFKLLIRLNLKKEFALKAKAYMEELDDNIRSFYNINRNGFFAALVYHFIGRFLGIVEIYIYGIAITPDFTFQMAILLGALSPIITVTFAFVPGALGVMEGAYGGLLYVMGLDPAVGAAIQIGRRVRAGFWIVVGLVFLLLHRRSLRSADLSNRHAAV
jgi:uncharacterized membrane protein YbhN (UPF0104 family)